MVQTMVRPVSTMFRTCHIQARGCQYRNRSTSRAPPYGSGRQSQRRSALGWQEAAWCQRSPSCSAGLMAFSGSKGATSACRRRPEQEWMLRARDGMRNAKGPGTQLAPDDKDMCMHVLNPGLGLLREMACTCADHHGGREPPDAIAITQSLWGT